MKDARFFDGLALAVIAASLVMAAMGYGIYDVGWIGMVWLAVLALAAGWWGWRSNRR